MSLSLQEELESRYVMGTYARKPVELVSGCGMKVVDDAGREYLDFVSGVGAVSLGHCHPAVVEALRNQAAKLIHVSNYYYIKHRAQVAQMLSDLLNGKTVSESASLSAGEEIVWKSFFANSGAEANECALKLARLAARKKHCAQGGIPDEAPRIIVTLQGSFHGRTLATLAATAQPAKQEAFQPLPDGFVRVPLNDVAALESLFATQGSAICAVLVECVQGESGVYPCTRDFLQAARRLTETYGALLICDEIQSGIYRCGTYPFAFQHFDIVPDIVSIAKGVASGVPAGICAARACIADAFEPGDHGSTFGGSCVAVAAARATLQTLVEQNIGENVEHTGAYLRERLAALPQVSEVRGLGLMVAAELTAEATPAPQVVEGALAKGLLLNATGATTLRFLPPLVCTQEDVDVLIDKLAELL